MQANDHDVLHELEHAAEEYDAYLAIANRDIAEILQGQSDYQIVKVDPQDEPIGIQLDDTPVGLVFSE